MPTFRPSWIHDFGPIDLEAGATRTVRFKPGYSELYVIGLKMDQLTAKRLYPCTADPGGSREKCEGLDRADWPAKLSFSLVAEGKDISSDISISKATGGGQYVADKTYTWQAAHVWLQRGVDYALTTRSLSDASRLSPAGPRLVLEVIPAGFLEAQALKQLGAWTLAALLLIATVIWFAIALLRPSARTNAHC